MFWSIFLTSLALIIGILIIGTLIERYLNGDDEE